MKREDCYKVGFILKPHGLKGAVTVSIDADPPENLDEVTNIFVDTGKDLVPYFVESFALRGDKAFVKFEDVDSPEAATSISKKALYLAKSTREKSGRGEFYDDEVVGFAVNDQEFGSLGKVLEVMSAGPNKLLVLNRAGKEILIPINSPFIKSVNKTKKSITVLLPDGFLEI